MKNNPIKYHKIRGINRRIKAIKRWGEINKAVDVDLLEQNGRDYVKFWVQPWASISFINSVYPEPTGDCEYLLIENLQKIYQSWQSSLETMQIPHYLHIWLFEAKISHSQVVCAIADYQNYYRNTFEQVVDQPKNGIQNSIHYNAQTAFYLDAYQWTQYRSIGSYDLENAMDVALLSDINPNKLLRKQIIWDKEHQIVELDKVWLNYAQ